MAPLRRRAPMMPLLAIVLLFSAKVLAVGAVLGVDLGTEYIKATLVKPGIPLEIVLTKDSRRKETSAVAFKPPKSESKQDSFPERIYGADALAIAARYPGEVYPNLKTLLGLSAEDAVVKEYAARHPGLQAKPCSNRSTTAFKSEALPADDDAWMVEELLAMELQNVQKNAQLAAGHGSSIESIVLTMPSFYTMEERRAVQSAAELAGLRVLALISDGLAVALNYATSRQFPNVNEGATPEHHMVFDMGAGSATATIIRFQSRTVKDMGKFNKTVQEVQVLGSGWDRTLGGDSLNYLIVDDMVSQFVDSDGAKAISASVEAVKSNGRTMARILKEAERLRQTLSANTDTQATLEALYEDVDFKYKITRDEFEAMAKEYGERVATTLRDAVKMSGVPLSELASVILHGGATRTPFVQKALEQVVGGTDMIRTSVNADEAAVFGAGFRAAEISPSFRVKEIRISEGPMYPAGLKWTTGSKQKQQRQRLWTATSPIGGSSKELTFTDKEDFTMTFFQQVGSEDRAINTLSTKNLTATVQAIRDKFPSCAEADLMFKLAVKLGAESAEVQVVKAAVECQAEVSEKEGFVDGVKNLLGLGKKDQQPLASPSEQSVSKSSDAPDKATEEITSEAPTASAATSSQDTKTSETSETESKPGKPSQEAKAVPKKKETVSMPVEFALEQAGLSSLSRSEFAKAKDRLKQFAASDEARTKREEALNQLEAYTYEVRDLLTSDNFIGHSTDGERERLATAQSEMSDWFDQEGENASRDILKAKLKDLTSLVSPIQKRISEEMERPQLVTSLKQVLGQTNDLVKRLGKDIADFEAQRAKAEAANSTTPASASSSASQPPANEETNVQDGDDKASMGSNAKVEETADVVSPLFSSEDVQQLEVLCKSTREWLVDTEGRQESLPPTADPVLLSKDLLERKKKLEKLTLELAYKASKKRSTKAKTGKAPPKSKKSDGPKKAKVKPNEDRVSGPELQEMLEKIQKMKEERDKEKANDEQVLEETKKGPLEDKKQETEEQKWSDAGDEKGHGDKARHDEL
ncbi:hypothetical protein CDD82_6030 [Ophiocordyceps australis]|uniref:Uncharacterized protein n=1 Tax=Ophiocordyceps australis TaxID=1399860 RepID=A0A2C5YS34_9HYPO|nr:hypothetical protein CDD82_6030 [Ophiocordyceps australis]